MNTIKHSLLLAAVTGTLGLAASMASANVIYQDNFTGSSTLGTLNGAAPTKDNGPSATWTASGVFADSGYANASAGAGARRNAFLSFTPVSGEIYTLSVRIDMTGTATGDTTASDNWFALGFMTTAATSGGWDVNGASPWVLSRYNGVGGAVFSGPGTAGGQGFAIVAGVNDYSIILNTGSSAWTYQVLLTNSSVTNKVVGAGTFTSNPAIVAVGLEDGLGLGKFSHFALTSSPVHGPKTVQNKKK